MHGLMLTDLSLSLTGRLGAEGGIGPPPAFNCLLFNSTLWFFFEPGYPYPFFEE